MIFLSRGGTAKLFKRSAASALLMVGLLPGVEVFGQASELDQATNNRVFDASPSNGSPIVASEADCSETGLANREWGQGDFEAFRRAVTSSATSPVLSFAKPGDLVLRYNDFVDPSEVVVVVQKPRSAESLVYRLPKQNSLSDTFDHLKHHLRTAAQRGCTRVVFCKDEIYEITPQAIGGRHLKFEGFRDCVIDLNGSTLRFTEPSVGIVISDCKRLTIQGGRIHGTSVLASVAEVVRQNLHVSFRVLPEFVAQLENAFPDGEVPVSTIGTAAQTEQGWELGTQDYFEWFVNRRGGRNRYRYSKESHQFDPEGFHLQSTSLPRNVKRVWLLHHNNSGHGVFLHNEDGEGIEDLTIQDVEFQNIPGMMIAGEVNRGLHLNRIRSTRDDNNPLSLFAIASDTIHLNGSSGDIVIENCNFGPSVDDKINIKSNFWRVTAVDRESGKVTVGPAGRKTALKRWGRTGQRVVFVDSDLQPITETSLANPTIGLEEKQHELTISDLPDGVDVGVLAVNVDTAGSRVIIRNNRFTGTRAQGVLVQTSNTRIDGNSFEDIAGPAIKLNFALKDWYEAICPANILIKDNTFTTCAFSPKKSSSVIHVQQLDRSGREISIISNVKMQNNRLVSAGR